MSKGLSTSNPNNYCIHIKECGYPVSIMVLNIVPLLQSILITSNGAWKLGGFGFAIPADQSSNDSGGMQAFHYAVSNNRIVQIGNI